MDSAIELSPIRKIGPESFARRESFAERYGPFILSLAIHASILAILNAYGLFSAIGRTPVRPESEIVRVNLDSFQIPPEPIQTVAATAPEPEPPALSETLPAQPDPQSANSSDPSQPSQPNAALEPPQPTQVAAAVVQPNVPAQFEPAGATQADAAAPSDDPGDGGTGDKFRTTITPEPEQPLRKMDSHPDIDVPASPSAPASPTGNSRERELAKLAEIQQRRKGLVEANEELGKKGSGQVGERLTEEAAKLGTKRALASTRGVANGPARGLDTTGVPQDVAEKVLSRYGIQIFYKDVSGEKTEYGFLNEARTSAGTFYNRAGHGVFQVISFGQIALSRMMQLEDDEMRKRGLDPAVTRVVEISYGIVATTKGYDLGVIKMEVAAIVPDVKK